MTNRDERIDQMLRLMVEMKLEQITLELPAMLIARLGGDAQRFTPDYILGLSLALFSLSLGMPAPLIALFGAVKMADMIYQQAPAQFTMTEFVGRMRAGFIQISPSFAAAMTDEVVRTATVLMLLDWTEDAPTPDDIEHDNHLYINMAMEYHGTTPDKTVLVLESRAKLESMLTDNEVPGELKQKVREALNNMNEDIPPDDLPPQA